MRHFLKLVALLITIGLPATTLAIENGINGWTGPEVDVRAYGAVCDGSTNDKTAFDLAYDSLTTNGGTISIPAGKTCMVGSDVNVESNVRLKCQPGGTIKAVSGGIWTFGMMEWFDGGGTSDDSPVEGCNFDLNGEHVPALTVFGERNPVTRSRFYGGDTTNGSAWSMVNYSCAGEGCDFSRNYILGADTAGANDQCLYVAGSTTAGYNTTVSSNNIRSCDLYGILTGTGLMVIQGNSVSSGSNATSGTGIHMAGSGSVVDNHVTCAGSSSECIEIAGSSSAARGNRLVASGSSAKGIKLSGADSSAVSNKITVSGSSGIAIDTDTSGTVIMGNTWALTAATGGTDDAIGVQVGAGDATYDINNNIIGNNGTVTTNDAQVHISVAGPLTTITGNNMTSGKYCIVPSQASAAYFGAAFNVTVVGNRCYAPTTSGVIAVAGWEVVGNYIAWGTSTGGAAVEVGEDRTYKVGTGGHTLITNNLLYWGQSGTPAIKANDVGPTCNGGTNIYKTCTADNTTDCPGATCGDCCKEQHLYGVQVVGNHLYQVTVSTGSGINLATGVSATSNDIFNWIIDGNTFTMAPPGSTAAEASPGIECSSSNQTKVYDVVVGNNSYYGYYPVDGDTNEGRISLNCTPNMVSDADTQLLWFPAAGCNANTAFPAYDIPTSLAPTPVCYGTNVRRGLLSYPQHNGYGCLCFIYTTTLKSR